METNKQKAIANQIKKLHIKSARIMIAQLNATSAKKKKELKEKQIKVQKQISVLKKRYQNI